MAGCKCQAVDSLWAVVRLSAVVSHVAYSSIKLTRTLTSIRSWKCQQESGDGNLKSGLINEPT